MVEECEMAYANDKSAPKGIKYGNIATLAQIHTSELPTSLSLGLQE